MSWEISRVGLQPDRERDRLKPVPRIKWVVKMTDRTFAPWVEPIALRDREGRSELLDFARSVPPDAWQRPSPLDGWSCRDVLTHVAGDTGKWFARILGAVIKGESIDAARVGPQADVDAINKCDVDERRDRPIEELISEVEVDGEEHEEMLSRLTEDHGQVRLAPYTASLAEFLSDSPAGNRGGHDREHLVQLRNALEAAS